ncbi:FemAB-related protein (PEP-CTERM system-associated) [Novosphingobium chloroacetimidivorans]|uniref:FemAB-related protein (PEP-CTERM system-associated) n=1 Tax=Novosphingobium chloroacetimidivorans TaxID=1428314 RepID=A0A7W7KAC1_9SPHN|nr:FemAB family XrtA/PEP-CTERM system-associated protein [Novosphingobium chloroacetimidivorans]MBB4858523.1 FemAB-related protein (PEP-CTERM system-associated) [Novosphingobium chloroacetimidivorans]
MNAPFAPIRTLVRLADMRDPDERSAIERFIAAHPQGTPFHLPAWLDAVEHGTGNRALALVAERGGALGGYLPLSEIHSPIFGRLMASTGFAVDGGLLLADGEDGAELLAAAERLATSHSCPTIELRGGPVDDAREGWALRTQSHCGFIAPLANDDEAQLTAIPRKQRAEVRKSLANEFHIDIGTSPEDRAAHYAVYAESVRNLGTPVFPRALFDAVLDRFGDRADILTVRHEGRPVASVLSLYWRGAVMPYWGGGTWDARRLRANDRMYYELMLHARRRGCARFDFGRSKTESGAYHFKRNWGFTPEPLSYAVWTAPGSAKRDADPTSAKHKLQIALWQKLPLALANRVGPWIARGLG